MPNCCGYGCDLWDEGICVPLQKVVDLHTRDNDCPIIGEIPDEHGRLIQAEEVKTLLHSGVSLDTEEDKAYVCSLIDDIPTIIEAST